MEYSRNEKIEILAENPLCACTQDQTQHGEILHQEEVLAKRPGPNWTIASHVGYCIILEFYCWHFSGGLILFQSYLSWKWALGGFKSFSNHIEEGSLWVSWILETSLTPVMLWHLSWSSAQGIIKNYFPASSTHLPGSLACRISKVKHVSPPHS